MEQRLLDVAEVLEIFRRQQLYAKSSKCEFGRQELGFLGRRLSAAGASVDPRKVQSNRRVGSANAVRRGAPLHGARQLQPPLRGGLLRAGGAVDGARQPDGALHVDRCRAGELRRAEAGPLLGPGAAHV